MYALINFKITSPISLKLALPLMFNLEKLRRLVNPGDRVILFEALMPSIHKRITLTLKVVSMHVTVLPIQGIKG